MTAMPTRHGTSTPRALSVWSLVLLLLAIASWRTMAPERSAHAMRRLVEARLARNAREHDDTRAGEVAELRRLRTTIARERNELLRLREDVKRLNYTAIAGARTPGKLADGLSDLPISLTEAGQRSKAQLAYKGEEEGKVEDTNANEQDATDSKADSATGSGIDSKNDDSAAVAQGCSVVLAPIAAETGLGTQTEHLLAHLTLAHAIEKACVALPPIVGGVRADSLPRYIPIHEVLDIARLSEAGLRFVPLSACKKTGVQIVFSDGIAQTTVLSSFERYVSRSDPVLAAETTLVNTDTRALEFAPAPVDVDTQAKHVLAARGSAKLYCAGLGRVAAPVQADSAVVKAYAAAPHVVTYVNDRFTDAEHTLFVRLRWRDKRCKDATDGMVCVAGGTPVRQEDYLNAVKALAKAAGAHQIYISVPAYAPEKFMVYLEKTMETVEPVVLVLEGDQFAADVVERELAVRARVFVPDGGVWGATVQVVRRYRNKNQSDESIGSDEMIRRWKDAGRPVADEEFVPADVREAVEEAAEEAVAAVAAAPDTPAEEELQAASFEVEETESGVSDGGKGTDREAVK